MSNRNKDAYSIGLFCIPVQPKAQVMFEDNFEGDRT
jgi:hypothetical protein